MALVILTAPAALAPAIAESPNGCRCAGKASACWPAQGLWDKLNTSVGGRLGRGDDEDAISPVSAGRSLSPLHSPTRCLTPRMASRSR